jgi:hypothetical protein
MIILSGVGLRNYIVYFQYTIILHVDEWVKS